MKTTTTAQVRWLKTIIQCTFLILLVGVACQSQAIPPQPTLAPAPTSTTQVDSLPPTATTISTPTSAPTATGEPVLVATLEPNGKIALKHLEFLTEEIGARFPGSHEETAAAGYIQTVFEGLGYDTSIQSFAFEDEDGDELGSQNVVATKPGISQKTLVVGAHYDSGDEGRGVDDNASGVAVLLEAAELIAQQETPYTVIFIAFGAEENDLDGSYYFVEMMSRDDIKNTVAMINLDSLAAGDLAYVYGDAGPGTLRDWVLDAASENGLQLEGKTAKDMDNEDGSPCECSDYDPFQKEGIQFIYFEATNWNLGKKDGMTQVDPSLGDGGAIRHTKFDTLASINQLFPGRIEEKLDIFTTLLFKILTEFQMP